MSRSWLTRSNAFWKSARSKPFMQLSFIPFYCCCVFYCGHPCFSNFNSLLMLLGWSHMWISLWPHVCDSDDLVDQQACPHSKSDSGRCGHRVQKWWRSGHGRVVYSCGVLWSFPALDSFFPDVDFAALTDNPVDYAIPFLLSRQCPLVALSVTEVPY